MLQNIIKKLALRYLRYDSSFVKQLLNETSTKTLTEAVADKKDLTSLLFKIRSKVVEVSEEFPQSTNKSHIEQTIEAIRAISNPVNGLVLDLGAARGQVAEEFLVGLPSNEFHLFEPLLENYTSCAAKFDGNGAVKVHKKAVGNEAGTTVINQSVSTQSSSLLGFSEDIRTDFFKERIGRVVNTETIEVVRLDDYLATDKQVWLMKLDLQGYEIEALKGSENLLKKTNFVLCEMMNHESYIGAPKYNDIDEYLRSKGFALLDMIGGLRRNHKLLEFDSLYYNTALISI